MPLVKTSLEDLIPTLIYDGLKYAGKLLLGPYWADFHRAHKKALKLLKKEFKQVELDQVFGNYINMELKLKFDKQARKNVVERFKRGLGGIHKEAFIDEIGEELYEYNKEYPRDLLKQVVTRYVEEVEIELRGNDEFLAYFQAYNTEQILQIVTRQSEHLGDFLDNVSLESIPEIPPQFVLPKEPYDEMMEALKKSNVLLIKGGAGIGKTILSAYLAHQLLEKDKPVFWYQITGAVDSFVPVLNRIAYFLSMHGQMELFDFFLRERTDDPEKMNRLIKALLGGEYFIFFDDIFKVKDEKLKNFLHTLCRRLYEKGGTRLFYLSRHLPGFIDEECVEAIGVPGLSKPETKSLLNKFDIKLEEKQSDLLAEKTKGNPKYLEFFKAWHSRERSKEEITNYIEKMPADDDKLQTYLLNNVYNDVLNPDHKVLLQSLAIFRIPETKDFLEEVYNLKNGKSFNDILDDLIRRLLLVDFLKDSKRYYAHDILIGFLQDRIDNKKKTHLKAGELYQKRALKEMFALDYLESSYHFQQGENNKSSADMILKISHQCMEMGWFWYEVLDILDKFSYESLEDKSVYASVLYDKGNLLFKMAQWNKAELTLKEYLKYETDPKGNLGAYNSLGLIYTDKGEWNKAIEFYNNALKGLEKIGDVEDPFRKHGMGQTYGNLGNVYRLKCEWDKAIEFHNKTLEIKEKVGDEHGMAYTFNDLGLVYKDKGEWDKAIEFYNKSLKIKQKIGDEHGMARTFNNLGLVYKDKGEWDKAIEFYNKALKGLEKIGDEHGMARTFNNLAGVHCLKGEWNKADEFYENSLRIKERFGDEYGMSQSLTGLGLVYQDKGEWDKAIEFYNKSLKIKQKIGDEHGMAQTFNNLGVVYRHKGEWDKAIEFCNKALKGLEKIGDEHGMAQTKGNIAVLYKMQGKKQQATKLFQEILEIFEKIGDKPNADKTRRHLEDL